MKPARTKEGAPYSDIRPRLRTFDLIFFRGAGGWSKIIAAAQEIVDGAGAGAYTHVGMVVRGDAFLPHSRHYTPPGPQCAAYIFESQNSNDDGIVNVHGRLESGVQLRNLDLVVAAYDGADGTVLGWSAMLDERRPHDSSWPAVFARYDGTPYENILHLAAAACYCLRPLRALLRSCCARCGYSSGSARQICSELVTNIYKDVGALPAWIESENVIPADYIVRPGAQRTFDADGEIPIMFEQVVPFTAYPRSAPARNFTELE